MFDRYFSGSKLSSAALVLVLVAAGFYFGACSSNKEQKTGKTGNAEPAAVATTAPSSTEAPAAQTGESKSTTPEGLPPEITEPCSGKNEGDACSVTTTDGNEIKGSCIMTRHNILGCRPEPVAGHQKLAPGVNQSDMDKLHDKSGQ